MLEFETSTGSVYEVDTVNHTIHRVYPHGPAPYAYPEETTWKHYEDISVEKNCCAIISWGGDKYTYTPTVRFIREYTL